jgi:lantibiotic modifying enzyme
MILRYQEYRHRHKPRPCCRLEYQAAQFQSAWCCRNFGIAEALNYVGQEADLPEAKNKSGILLEESLDRGLKGGFFRLQSSLGENFCFSPRLFRGTAGIGYSLLRTAFPGELPCILAFEA